MPERRDVTIPKLREMKKRNAVLGDQTRVLIEGLHIRFRSVEAARVSLQHAETVDALMARLAVRELTSRIEAVERRVRELEGHQ